MRWAEVPGLGATHLGGGLWHFLLWAPFAERVEVHIVGPRERFIPLEREERGYHRARAEGVEVGSLYFYRLDGRRERPDPASRSQPAGVHGPSQVVEASFPWGDAGWRGLPLEEYILYEVHVGTYTPGGTFEAILPHLEDLRELGVTAIELMPVAQFPGGRNWGYDGVFPYAAQESYGGPRGLKRLVDACHGMGIAVVLDVVYNHLGPEGNCLGEFGPYFDPRRQTPWGPALNLDGPWSDEVRRFFIENALYWVSDCHVDALRLDAVHAILDLSPRPFLEELGEAVRRRAGKMGRRVHLIAESDRNDVRLVLPRDRGGCGLDALWSDDFHHSLHALLTGEKRGYYQDFGSLSHLSEALAEGFTYTGQYSPFRRRRQGSPSRGVPACRHIVFAQNHDQVGNRMGGERLSHLVSFEKLKLAAGLVFLSPYVPLLFMGEEYGERAPFLYFVSHSEPALIEAVRRGRREEFSAFRWEGEPPDPQDEGTFLRSKLDHGLRQEVPRRALREFYGALIASRKELPALATLSKDHLEVRCFEAEKVLFLRRWSGGSEVFAAFHFGGAPGDFPAPVPPGSWGKRLDSAEERWGGTGGVAPEVLESAGEVSLPLAPSSFFLYARGEGGRDSRRDP